MSSSDSDSDSDDEGFECSECGTIYEDYTQRIYDNVCSGCVEPNDNRNDNDDNELVSQLQQTKIIDDVDFTLSDIQKNKEQTLKYLKLLSKNVPLSEVIKEAHNLCPELERFCEENNKSFKCNKDKDKGSLGKLVEYYIFGQLPNNNSNPDLDWVDIKATNFKYKSKQDAFNAKERLTITNCGSKNNYDSFNVITDSDNLKECPLYKKLSNGLLFVFEFKKGRYNNINTNLSKKLLCIIHYDLSKLDEEIQNILEEDFQDIKNRIINKDIHQAQKYLHICKHGGKKCKTYALAFTNKFLTKLVAIGLGKDMIEIGSQYHINSDDF